MRRIFVDTNVILDVLLQREEFWEDSLTLFKLAESDHIRAYVSASSMTDVFYVVKKKLSMPVARKTIENLLYLFDVVSVDYEDLRGALSIPIDDFEDALQAHCAVKVKADVLVTRDVGGFKNIGIAVTSPADFDKVRNS